MSRPAKRDAATKFDEESNDRSQLAIEHAEALRNLLWSMNTGKVPQVEVALRPDNEVLQKYMDDRKMQCPKVQKLSFREDSISLDGSRNTEDQKDVVRQLAAIIATQVKSTKESVVAASMIIRMSLRDLLVFALIKDLIMKGTNIQIFDPLIFHLFVPWSAASSSLELHSLYSLLQTWGEDLDFFAEAIDGN